MAREAVNSRNIEPGHFGHGVTLLRKEELAIMFRSLFSPSRNFRLEAYFLLGGYFSPVKGCLAVISSIRAVMATPSAIKRAPA
jgi:hypothetical protein